MPEEDRIEDDMTKPGKILAVNDNDDDGDGIPDFADGFDWDGITSEDDRAAFDDPNTPEHEPEEQFVPVILVLPEGVNPSVAKVKLTYSASDPKPYDAVTNPDGLRRTGSGTPESPYQYTPGTGNLRIWKKDGGEARSATADFLENGVGYDWTSLPPHDDYPDGSVRRLWVEAITLSTNMADRSITVSIDPDGPGPTGFIASDTVLASAVKLDFVVPDASGNPVSAPPTGINGTDEAPLIHIDPLTIYDLTLSPSGVLSFTIQGTVTDAIADIVPDDAANPAALGVLLNGGEVTSFPIFWTHEQPTVFRPYAGYGSFTQRFAFRIVDPGGQTATYDVTLQATNALGSAGLAAIQIEISGDDLATAQVTAVQVSDAMELGQSTPFALRLLGPQAVWHYLQNSFEGSFQGESFDLVSVPAAGGAYYLGHRSQSASKPSVFALAIDELPPGITIPNLIVASGGYSAVLAAAAQPRGRTPAARAQAAQNANKVIITHITNSQADCPQTGPREQTPMYAILFHNGAYYSDVAGTGPGQLRVWDGNYWFSLEEGNNQTPPYAPSGTRSWVEKLDKPVNVVRWPGAAITYAWSEVIAARDPQVTAGPAHSGMLVKYSASAANPTGIPAPANTYTVNVAASEGVRYYYCRITAADQNGRTLWDNGTFINRSRLSPAQADAYLHQSAVHKLIAGDYAGQTRTLAEWAATHVGLPYGYGAKDKYINEDCSGLVAAIGVQVGKPNMDIWTAGKMVDMAANNLTTTTPKMRAVFDLVGQGVTLTQLSTLTIRPGYLIAHRPQHSNTVTHVVVVSADPTKDPNGIFTSMPIIECQGFDDRGNANHIDRYHSSSEVCIRHDYLSEYLNLRDSRNNTPYVARWYVFKFHGEP